ncbi:hypothetical protein AB9T89_21005 [Flavobacterium oncorhynchi]|uniref:hypothetical protein n=1 Tax=Flavobacterium oncorhynchi TaxID=728056 RepID=UPI00351A9BE9
MKLNSLLKGNRIQLNEQDLLNCLLILMPERISQDKFKMSIYLLIKELYELNNTKYGLVMNIAKKVFNEAKFHVYQLNYNELKSEIKLYI